MTEWKDLKKFLQHHSNEASIAFHNEIVTDENKDYRRGFRAGVFFAFLQMKSDLWTIEDATTEQPTD